ncbi:CBS domain-containing protein [Microvirga sp. 2TAF3]|uniref:CBS domain-containing protein n=1 Tax=Microvirga sp. 2TAF3 TaxID=3233014 RepID=UPI003F975553
MQASDIMITDVITVRPDTTVGETARILLEHRISGAPVIDRKGHLVGIVSEGDLMRRAEIGTEKHRSWWLSLFSSTESQGSDFIKAHALRVSDVMTTDVVTAKEDTALSEVATLLERNGIKRVPIIRNDSIIGIVSRANLLQAFASVRNNRGTGSTLDDQNVRRIVIDHIRSQPWGMPWLLTVTVDNGTVNLWGPVNSDAQAKAIRIAAETTPGVRGVRDNLYRWPLRGAID